MKRWAPALVVFLIRLVLFDVVFGCMSGELRHRMLRTPIDKLFKYEVKGADIKSYRKNRMSAFDVQHSTSHVFGSDALPRQLRVHKSVFY